MADPLASIYRASLGSDDPLDDAAVVERFLAWLDPARRAGALSDAAAAESAVCRYRSERAAAGANIWELRQIDSAVSAFYAWLGIEMDGALLTYPATRLPIVPLTPQQLDELMITVVRFGPEVEAAVRLLASGLWVSEVATLRATDLRAGPAGMVAKIRVPNRRDRDVPLGPACSAAIDIYLGLTKRFLFQTDQPTTEHQLVYWCRRLFSESGAGKFKHKALRRSWIQRLLVAGMDLSVVALVADGMPLVPHLSVLPGERDPFYYVAAVEPAPPARDGRAAVRRPRGPRAPLLRAAGTLPT